MESEQKENCQPLLKQRYEPFQIEETKENVEIEQENKFDQFKDFVFGIQIQKSQRDVQFGWESESNQQIEQFYKKLKIQLHLHFYPFYLQLMEPVQILHLHILRNYFYNCYQELICCLLSLFSNLKSLSYRMHQILYKKSSCIDGGNDVGMIQPADVGIGIEGKEGKQAALASNFSIIKFKYLNVLLLQRGRLSYKRSALLSQFVILRGLIISVIQAVFMFVFYFLSISIFSDCFQCFPQYLMKMLKLNYSLIPSTLQIFKKKARDLKTFLVLVWKSMFQGVIIIFLILAMFKKIFLEIETVAFTALKFNQYALTLSELYSLHFVMKKSNVTSAVIQILSNMWFENQLLVSVMTFYSFFNEIVVILVIDLLVLLPKRYQRNLIHQIMKRSWLHVDTI
ncbi:unnamed protein product [Paramecium pentaurelia]|uniref:P-type ATPase C-terminal domain-containing protein n=1 Tax=Paramecium pentaurelia TaxID=43138 RepID=A0A8S1WIU4_9CILI|nr:unnamed protein product [Paramecium pentaurelia]